VGPEGGARDKKEAVFLAPHDRQVRLYPAAVVEELRVDNRPQRPIDSVRAQPLEEGDCAGAEHL
jgi:hypothetical protein